MLLGLLLAAGSLCAAAAPPAPTDDTPPTETIIDVLSLQPQFLVFLRRVQRGGLVPYLNALGNSTLFAPTNLAYYAGAPSQALTEETLARYLAGSPLDSGDIDGAVVVESLHEAGGSRSPLLLVRRGGGFSANGAVVVEPDLHAESSNNVVHGIRNLMTEPVGLAEWAGRLAPHTHSRLGGLVGASSPPANVTLLLPEDAVVGLSAVEHTYLMYDVAHPEGSKKLRHMARRDRQLVVDNYVVEGYVGGNVSPRVAVNLNGVALGVQHLEEWVVNATVFRGGDGEVLDDAMVQVLYGGKGASRAPWLDSHSVVEFTPAKVLLGMNCTQFVEALQYNGLMWMVLDLAALQTVFVLRDDSDDESVHVASPSKQERASLYLFIDGQVDLWEAVRASQHGKVLVDTRLCVSKHLGPHQCSKMAVTVRGRGRLQELVVNNQYRVTRVPAVAGNTQIYVTEEEVEAPPNILTAVAPYFQCSRSMAYLFDLDMLLLANNHRGYTVFLPCYGLWKSLGLTFQYLESNRTALELILGNMVLQGLVYSDFHGGDPVELESLVSDTVEVRSASAEGVRGVMLNGSFVPLEFTEDVMFHQGVIHPVEQLIIPDSLTIGLMDLVGHASKHDGFFEGLLAHFGLEHYLESTSNHLVLLPLTEALRWSQVNESFLFPDLERLVRMHILPPGLADLVEECEPGVAIPTLQNDTQLVCEWVLPERKVLLVHDGDLNHEVLVLERGWTNPSSIYNAKENQCVFLVDRPLLPEWANRNHGRVVLRLPFLALAVGALAGVLLILLVFLCCMMVVVGRRGGGKIGSRHSSGLESGEGSTANESSHETSPILGATGGGRYGASEGTAPLDGYNEAAISENAQIQPIRMNSQGMAQALQRDRFLPG